MLLVGVLLVVRQERGRGRKRVMGKLIDQEQRARAREARKDRKLRIKRAALELFDRQPLSEVTLNGVGRRAGLRDGLPTLYFGSKEELHLELVGDEVRVWLDAVCDDLDRAEAPLDPPGVARLVRRSIEGRVLMQRFLTQLAVVVEQTSDISAALAFQHGLDERLASAGQRLEQTCPVLESGRGRWLLHRTLLLVIGLSATARWLDVSEPHLGVDVGAELEVLLEALMTCPWPAARPTT